jgi:acetyl esterase
LIRQSILTALTLGLISCDRAQVPVSPGDASTGEPEAHVYKTLASRELSAYVFRPSSPRHVPAPAILVFHGGGWSIGSAEWAFPRARHFAALGMVAIAVQYRLSDQISITPLDAVADAQAAFRWARENAESLGVDPGRIAAYGWSAGAHLAASAAIFDEAPNRRSSPDALVLASPAVALEEDGWFGRLLMGAAAVEDVNPVAHVRRGFPPTVILQGATDTVTPLPGVREFCERLRSVGTTCELHVFPGVGHLFTPASLPDDGDPQPDPAIQAEALSRARAFLAKLEFIPP